MILKLFVLLVITLLISIASICLYIAFIAITSINEGFIDFGFMTLGFTLCILASYKLYVKFIRKVKNEKHI